MCIFPGLAVVPTWIAMKEHVPVEVEGKYESEVEQIHRESEILEDDKRKIAVVKSTEA